MFSATSSLAAAISRIDDDDSSAAAASISTECAICLSDAVISCSDAAVSSMAPSCCSIDWRPSSSPFIVSPTSFSCCAASDSSACSLVAALYDEKRTPAPASAMSAMGIIMVVRAASFEKITAATTPKNTRPAINHGGTRVMAA